MAQLPPTRQRTSNAPPRTPAARGGGGETVAVSLPKERATPENILLAIFAHYGLRSGAEVERALDDAGYWQRAIDDLTAKGIPQQVARLARGARYEARWGVPADIVRELRAHREQARTAPATRTMPVLPLPPLNTPLFDPMLAPPGVHPNAPVGGGGPGRFGNAQPAGMGDGGTRGELDPRGVLGGWWDGVSDFIDSLQCVEEAFERAQVYAPQAILDETGYALGELVAGLVPGLLLAGATLGGTTAIGAGIGGVIGFFGGGVGAAPGAAAGAKIGFDVGLAILTWLGLAMLVVHIGTKIGEAGDLVGKGVARAWEAGGKPPQVRTREVNEAARDLARAVGVLFRLILEGIVAYVLAKGAAQATARVAQLVERLKASRLGAGFARWVETNWQRLVDDPRLNRNARGGGRPGDEVEGAPPRNDPSNKPPARPIPSARSLAEQRAAELRASTSRSKLPSATSAAVDRTTGQAYYGSSGKPLPTNVHPELRRRMPAESLESWAVENCAEFKAVNEALHSGAKIENLDLHTVVTRSGNSFPRCANCQITTRGTNVSSDR